MAEPSLRFLEDVFALAVASGLVMLCTIGLAALVVELLRRRRGHD
jgi:hypothetical protein